MSVQAAGSQSLAVDHNWAVKDRHWVVQEFKIVGKVQQKTLNWFVKQLCCSCVRFSIQQAGEFKFVAIFIVSESFRVFLSQWTEFFPLLFRPLILFSIFF